MSATVEVKAESGGWIVRVTRAGEKMQEFTCATEFMARQLASVFIRAHGRPAPRAA